MDSITLNVLIRDYIVENDLFFFFPFDLCSGCTSV